MKALIFSLLSFALLFCFFYRSPKEMFLFLLAALYHEFGHLLALLLCRVKLRSLKLSPAGATMQIENELLSYRKEFWIAVAGPLASAFVPLLALVRIRQGMTADGLFFFFCNFFLAFLNLIPIRGLDGGRAFHALLGCFFSFYTTEAVSRTVSAVMLVFMFLSAVVLLLTKSNPSLGIVFLFLLRESLDMKKESCEAPS